MRKFMKGKSKQLAREIFSQHGLVQESEEYTVYTLERLEQMHEVIKEDHADIAKTHRRVKPLKDQKAEVKGFLKKGISEQDSLDKQLSLVNKQISDIENQKAKTRKEMDNLQLEIKKKRTKDVDHNAAKR